jgi:hypothetical protein
LLQDIKNKINSGDWLILNEKDFSPMMSIVKKSVFEAKFYFGTILKGYSYVTVDDERGTIKEPATALQVTAPLSCTASALINFPVAESCLNTFFAFNILIYQGNYFVKVFFRNLVYMIIFSYYNPKGIIQPYTMQKKS